MAQIIKAGTKRAEQLLDSANRNLGNTLRSVYSSWSLAKEKAYNDCLREKVEDKGNNFRITGANGYKFTVAWEFDYVDEETGVVVPATKIRTADNTYIVLHEEV